MCHDLSPVVLHTQMKPSSAHFLYHVFSPCCTPWCCTPWVHLRKEPSLRKISRGVALLSPLLERWGRGDKSPASLKTLPYSGFYNILRFQASEAQSIKVGEKVNQNSDVPKSPLQHGAPEHVWSSTGHGWTRGSPPSFLSSKAGGRAFPVLTLPVPRPVCLQGGGSGSLPQCDADC